MTESGNPKENAIAERVNNTIKNEFLKGMSFSCVPEVREAVKAAVDFYNHERPHWSLDGMTPSEAAGCEGELRKRWVSYRERAIKEKMGITDRTASLEASRLQPQGKPPWWFFIIYICLWPTRVTINSTLNIASDEIAKLILECIYIWSHWYYPIGIKSLFYILLFPSLF